MPRKEIELDLRPLGNLINKNASKGKIPLKEALASSRFAQVGINLFRDNVDSCIWKLEKSSDGVDYIIRAEPAEALTIESSNGKDWIATTDSTKEMITLSFCGMPIMKFAGKDYDFNRDTAEGFKRYLLSKTQDTQFIKSLVALATDKCPGCGGKPVYIGLDGVLCNTPGCIQHKIAQSTRKTYAQGFTTSKGQEEQGVPYFVNGKYSGDLNLDKAREYEQSGIVELVQTPQGLIAKKK